MRIIINSVPGAARFVLADWLVFVMPDTEILGLYISHQSKPVKYANSIVGDDDRARDITQDAFERFSVAMAEDWRANPVGYLYRIVRNLALDRTRRTKFESALFTQTADSVAESVPADSPTPEQEIIAQNELNQLYDAMQELPERTRVAMEMHRLGGYKMREIAEHLDISQSMVQYLIKEGVKHCRRRLTSSFRRP